MKKILSVFLMALLLSSCGTIFTGTSDTVSFYTDEAGKGGKLYLNDVPVGNIGDIPIQRSLKKSKDYNYKFVKDGYETSYGVVDKNFNSVSILNLFGIWGWLIDAVTGAVWTYEDTVFINVEK